MRRVLLHGWGMHSGVWGETLVRHPDTLAPDLPGHGRRPRDERLLHLGDVADEIVTLVGESALWVGWSLGGLVAQRIALDYPERVRGLALVGSSACFVARPDWPHGMALEVYRAFAADLERDHRATLDRFAALEVHGSEDAREELREIRRRLHAYDAPSAATLRDGLELLADNDLRRELPGLSMPALLLAGGRDRLVPPAAMAATAALIPGAELRILSGAGHAPFLRHPESFVAELNAFAERVFHETSP